MPFKNLKDLTLDDKLKEIKTLRSNFAELLASYFEKQKVLLPSNVSTTKRQLKYWRNRWIRVRAAMSSTFDTPHIDEYAKDFLYLHWGVYQGIPQEEIREYNMDCLLQ